MRLLDWLLGRGRNPLEVPETTARAAAAHASAHALEHDPEPAATEHDPEADRLADEADQLLRQQAQALGVDVPTLVEMLEQRELFVAKVEAEPRVWGFDLLAPDAPRRDVVGEYRRASRLTGTLGESFLSAYEPLMTAVPDPLTLPPDGMQTLPELLEEVDGISPEAAADIAQHLRTTLQATLGRPLEAEAVGRAVREAAWDHDFDAAVVLPKVLEAMEDVL